MKRSLIFLHGGPGFKDYLRPYFQDLNGSFNSHFFDQLQGPNVVLEDLIQQLWQIVSLQSNPVIVGHSWGGTLACEFALRYPEAIYGIVLICSALSSQQWVEYHKDLKNLGLEDASPEKIFLVPEDLEQSPDFLSKTWSTFSVETFNSLNRTYINNFDLTGRLNGIRTKFLNIYADNDLRIPPRIPKSFQVYNPAILNYCIRGSGHFPFLQEKARNEIHQILRDSFS